MPIIKRFVFFLIINGLVACTQTVSSVAVNEKMVLIAPNVFVDQTMSVTQQQQFLHNLTIAKNNIQHFFGSIEANPTVYACITPTCAGIFSGVKAKAKAYGASKILLTEKALDQTTITHELAHIELHQRIGSQQAWHKIPMWFDEGLAVFICNDPRYDETQWQKIIGNNNDEVIALDNLVTQQQWMHAVQQQKWPYGIARKAVQEWYTMYGHQALETLILQMKQGRGFSLSQYPYENNHKNNKNILSKHL